jgi:uncharacterized Fe-S cluster-containing radical SAM superfamily protein
MGPIAMHGTNISCLDGPKSERKFDNPSQTVKGERRASVCFRGLDTLWVNTGTLCNIECANCYIESSPLNNRLSYFTAADLTRLLDDAARIHQTPRLIGFTGGEPFMNPAMIDMLGLVLARGHDALILTNAMRPMMRARVQAALLDVRSRFPKRLTVRVSIDHFRPDLHDEERGTKSFDAALRGLKWLVSNRFQVSVAGRLRWGDGEDAMRHGYGELFTCNGIDIDVHDPEALILFPEMDEAASVPEISEGCWSILRKRPEDMMCATSRMVVKRRGAAKPSVVACTLLPYDERFDFGPSLVDALSPVKLNHPHCSKFCVLGGGSCSA